jgi:hypothetical protein
MVAPDCLLALLAHRSSRFDHNPNAARHEQNVCLGTSSYEESSITESAIDGEAVAAKFAREAHRVLDEAQLQQLLAFLSRCPIRAQRARLNHILSNKLQAFYQAEISASGDDPTRLARPSGPEDAEIGVIMHCQSEEDAIGAFWNTSNFSIRVLADKGLNDDFAFGFDWHWRATDPCRGQGRCPARKWKPIVTALHDAFSQDVLRILPLPFVMIAGACSREKYQQTLSEEAKRLEVAIGPGVKLTFDLDYRGKNGLRRIATYVDHPAAAHFQPQATSALSLRIDAALDFFFWLTGRTHTTNGAAKNALSSVSFKQYGGALGNAKKMQNLRKRLLEGDIMHCTLMKNGTKMGRIYFRGVSVCVQDTADFTSVRIRCDLSEQGAVHPDACAQDAKTGDPSQRLAILLAYTDKHGSEKISAWYKQKGDVNAKKLNSLVDFLEGRDIEYTEAQPRRWLDKCAGRGRLKPMFFEEGT